MSESSTKRARETRRQTAATETEFEEKPLRYIIQNLEATFGEPRLKPKSAPLDMLVNIILSQATTDILSAQTFAALKERFKTWDACLAADETEIAETIKLGGLANQKSRVIKNLLAQIKAEHGTLDLNFLQDLPTAEAAAYLSQFRGIGPKTVACTLLFALHKEVFPLDTHIFRVLKRIGILPEKITGTKAHRLLNELVPKGKFYSLHVNLIRLGRKICRPREPLSGAHVRIHLTGQNITRDVSLEEYVLGVVTAEGSIEDELEALMALSVASRTFAL
jgi:endonuclease-3